MFGPDWDEGCASCAFLADHIDGARLHLGQRDVTLVAASRAPLAKLQAFRARMGWNFPWVSSGGSDFNYDFGVSFAKEDIAARGKMGYNYARVAFPVEDAHGLSAFYRDEDGGLFHTYSTYSPRGVDQLVGAYAYLDLAPMGRNEDALPWTMAWVRHHDRYDAAADGCRRGLERAGAGPRAALTGFYTLHDSVRCSPSRTRYLEAADEGGGAPAGGRKRPPGGGRAAARAAGARAGRCSRRASCSSRGPRRALRRGPASDREPAGRASPRGAGGGSRAGRRGRGSGRARGCRRGCAPRRAR